MQDGRIVQFNVGTGLMESKLVQIGRACNHTSVQSDRTDCIIIIFDCNLALKAVKTHLATVDPRLSILLLASQPVNCKRSDGDISARQ
jgi:hypothetical protein